MSILDTMLGKVTEIFTEVKYHEKLLNDINKSIINHEKRLTKLESTTELNISKLKNILYEEAFKLNTGLITLKKQKQLENNP